MPKTRLPQSGYPATPSPTKLNIDKNCLFKNNFIFSSENNIFFMHIKINILDNKTMLCFVNVCFLVGVAWLDKNWGSA